MKKRVIIVHGWEGHPEQNWFPWLKRALEEKGFEVLVPRLPHPEKPEIKTWVSTISSVVKNPDENTYFVGHSMGCQAIVRYLLTLPKEVKVGGVIFVAGFFKRLTNLEDSDNYETVEPEWIKTPINLEEAAKHINKSVALFSDNDPYVPLDNQDGFREKLGSEVIIEHNMGHYNDGFGIKKAPLVLEKLLEMAK